MDKDIEAIKQLYTGFNAKKIDVVLALLTDDVVWANAMDGGHVQGHGGIREYWTRQWSMVDPHVEPVNFHEVGADTIVVDVVQTIRDLEGKLLQGQSHGLKNKTVEHVFQFKGGLVARFDVQDAP